MLHVIFSLASRFLYLRNILQGFARGILTLRSLHAISSHLIPALSPPPPLPLLDTPAPSAERLEEINLPYPSRDVIAIERQFTAFASPFPIYQSSLVAVSPSQFPKFLPIFVILAVISGFVVSLPEIAYFFKNIAKSFKSKPKFYCLPISLPSQFTSSKIYISLVSLLLLWTGPPVIATSFTFVWFMSILFSYEPVSDMVVAILQRCGLLVVQDTRTPPLLDAIYKQITRGTTDGDLVWSSDLSDKDNKYQIITDYSLGYSHMAAQLSAYEFDPQITPVRGEYQESEVSVQRIHTESVNSRSLHQQLELSRAREQKLDTDLLASEHERERLIALVSSLEDSCRDQEEWKELYAISRSLSKEAEILSSDLRADFEVATDCVRKVQEQLDHQTELASGKDSIIQSITKESKLAHTRLRLECDRRRREMKEFLRDLRLHKSENRRLTQEAQDAQEQLNALRDTLSQLRSDRQTPVDCNQPLPYQPPLPPEWNLGTGSPPVSSAIDPNSPRRSTKSSPRSPSQDSLYSSVLLASRLLRIPGACDQESKVAKKLQAALTELIERIPQVEPESAEDVKSNERDETCLQEELVSTREQLRLAEEDVRGLRRELGQLGESLREVESHVRTLEYELDTCRATVREAQEAQHASEVKFTEATQLVRVHQAESESSMARAEESQFNCSQATLLCTSLRERVTELEAEVKKLKSARKYQEHFDSRSRRPIGSPTDIKAIEHDADSDSIYMTVPSSMPRLLDLSLPPSSPFNDNSLYLSHQEPECPPIPLAPTSSANTDIKVIAHDADSNSIFMAVRPSMPRLLKLSLLPAPSPFNDSPLYLSHQECPPMPLAFAGSANTDPEVDRNETFNSISLPCLPELPSTLFAEDMDLDPTTSDADSSLPRQAFPNLCRPLPRPKSEDFSLSPFLLSRTFLSERSSLDSVDWPPTGSSLLLQDGNARQDDNISPRSPNGDDLDLPDWKPLSPINELDELEVADPSFSGPVLSNNDRKSPSFPHSSQQGLVSRDHVFGPQFPVFPRIALPRLSLSPPGVRETLERCLGSSELGNHSNSKVGSVAPDPFRDGLLSSSQNAESYPTVSNHQETSSLPRGGTPISPTMGQEVSRAVPAHPESLHFSIAVLAGDISSLTSPNTVSPPVLPPSVPSLPLSIPVSLEDCGRPAVLGSRHKGTDLKTGSSSSRTALRSTSRLRTSADKGTSMRAPRPSSRRDYLPESNCGNVTSARKDMAPEASLSSSDDFPISTSRSTGVLLSRIPILSNVSLVQKDAKTQAVKRISKSMPLLPPSRPVPELEGQAFLCSGEASLDKDDPLCVSGKARKGGHPNNCRISFRPRDTSSPDCSPPRNSLSTFWLTAPQGQAHNSEDLVFVIPSDCPTSTPLASAKRASGKYSADSGAGGTSFNSQHQSKFTWC